MMLMALASCSIVNEKRKGWRPSVQAYAYRTTTPLEPVPQGTQSPAAVVGTCAFWWRDMRAGYGELAHKANMEVRNDKVASPATRCPLSSHEQPPHAREGPTLNGPSIMLDSEPASHPRPTSATPAPAAGACSSCRALFDQIHMPAPDKRARSSLVL